MVYLTLFFSAFVSATLWPMGSEAALLYALSRGYAAEWLWVVATAGNTLGAAVNYWMGLGGETMLEKKKLIRQGALVPIHGYFERWGAVTLLLSWVPVVGDLFTFVAGIVRYPFGQFLLWVLVAKGGRYAVLIFGWSVWQ
jgi:membrane protein YqaA with SNARE-associated domain